MATTASGKDSESHSSGTPMKTPLAMDLSLPRCHPNFDGILHPLPFMPPTLPSSHPSANPSSDSSYLWLVTSLLDMVSISTVHDGQCLKNRWCCIRVNDLSLLRLYFHPSAQVHPLMHDFSAPCWKALLLMDKSMSPLPPNMTCSSVIAGPWLLEWAHLIACLDHSLIALGDPAQATPWTCIWIPPSLHYVGAERSNFLIKTMSPMRKGSPDSRFWIFHDALLWPGSTLQKLSKQYWIEFMLLPWYRWHLKFLPLPFGHSWEHLDVLNDDGLILFLFEHLHLVKYHIMHDWFLR